MTQENSFLKKELEESLKRSDSVDVVAVSPIQTEAIDSQGVWHPGVFNSFSEEVAYGGSTKHFKKGIGMDPDAKDLGLLRESDRLAHSMAEKWIPARFLIKLLRDIDPSADPHNIIKTQLTHSKNIVCVDDSFVQLTPEEKIRHTLETDGLITNIAGQVLYITAADCTPIAIYDPVHNAIGLFHSGWKGTVQHIATEGIKKMAEQYGTRAEDIRISIGPSVNPDDYEVDTVVYNKFVESFSPEELKLIFKEKGDGKYLLNVPKAIELDLHKAGVVDDHIETSSYTTTGNNDTFPSARVGGGIGNIDAAVCLFVLRKKKEKE
ncbi:MAG: laccase domain-containing protein [Parcubacteria group bacterium]|nr:laccase domain-containing protein [Parcubacteria group bacterium]